MGKRDKLRSVRSSVKNTAKDTLRSICKHLRIDDTTIVSDDQFYPRRSILPSHWDGASEQHKKIAHTNSTIPDGCGSSSRPDPCLTPETESTIRSNKQNDARRVKFDTQDPLEQLAELIERRFQDIKSTLEGTDDDIAADIQEYVPVRMKSFKSAERLKIDGPARPRIPSPAKENSRLSTIFHNKSTIICCPGPETIQSPSLKMTERSGSTCSTQLEYSASRILEPDYFINGVIMGIDPHEDSGSEASIDYKELKEGFMEFLHEGAPQLRGPASLVRIHGADFYEYSRPAPLPPFRESLDATCALYDSTYSIRSASGIKGSLTSTEALKRELEIVRVTEDMYHRRTAPPEGRTFQATDMLVGAANHSERWKDPEMTADVRDGSSHADPSDVFYENGVDQSNVPWRWEARLNAMQVKVTVDEVSADE